MVLLGMLSTVDVNLTTEECDIETNDIVQNKTITLIKKIVNHLLLQEFYLYHFQ